MSEIVNAAPMVIDLGTRDLSTRVVPESVLEIPQHLPKFYLFAEKGKLGPTYVDFSNTSLTGLYGDETFNVNSKYFTHQTVFAQAVAAAGNNFVVHRLAAPDAKDVANLAMYLDVLPCQVPLYVKGVDGSITLDVNGNPTVQLDSNSNPVMIGGYKVKWVLDKTVANLDEYQRGLLTARNGTQFDAINNVQSQQYPIFEFAASSPGEAGNKLAIKMYAAMQSDLVPFPSNILQESKLYPYYFQLVKVVDTLTGKTNSVYNTFGGQYSKYVVKKNGLDPASGAVIDLDKVIFNEFINVSAADDKGLGVAYTYTANLESVLTMLYNAEKVISDSHRDGVINNTDANLYALNIFSFTSSNGSPYQSVKLIDDTDSTRLTKNTNLFLSGSTDGTIDLALLDSLVAADMDMYNNGLSEYNDLVLHPESIIYDSGFSLNTKKAMCKFISRRKDTFTVLSTYAHNAPSITLSDQYSVGVALKTMIELYPESATFGTPVMRGMIVGGSGTLINSLYNSRVPLTYEIAYKAARYMGAKNGAWKNGFAFDRAPNSLVRNIKDIDVTWVPASTRNTLWGVGLNFVLNYKIRTQFFPALQTVYENDTSVLNSFFTAVAIAYLNKVSHAAWREFTGSISLTNAQLEEQVNNFVANIVKDKFDSKFIIVPNATVTELDNLRGFSWTLPISIYANNMKTVMQTFVEAYRISDLSA
ncbi:MAG: Tail sheath [uncultured bacterium]|nr:MAG: Tail sheath [uncultured bacterium]